MGSLKSFIYLDEYKMSSISSQMFEGITEYLVSVGGERAERSEEQKGEIGSGRILADALSKDSSVEEKRVLNDYLYSIFESRLVEEKKVLEIGAPGIAENEEKIASYPFVKIRAKATFNDINSIRSTIRNFNELGESLTYVTNFEKLKELEKKLEEAKKTTKDRNAKDRLQREYKAASNLSKLAEESGMRHDQDFLKHLDYLLGYGFGDQLEVKLEHDNYVFSANLNREWLREKEDLLIRKYSRITDLEFVVFGIVAQMNNSGVEESDEGEEYESLKEGLMALAERLTDLENQFFGRLPGEIILDPIAVYTEL